MQDWYQQPYARYTEKLVSRQCTFDKFTVAVLAYAVMLAPVHGQTRIKPVLALHHPYVSYKSEKVE